MNLRYVIKTSSGGTHIFKLCLKVAMDNFLMHHLWDRGTPFTAVLQEKYKLRLFKMTCKYLLELSKDIKVRNSPKITPKSSSGQIKHQINPLCNVKILVIMPQLDPSLPRSPQRALGQGLIYSLTCPLPASLYRHTSHPSHFHTISLTVCPTNF